jgi:hypothetical protein
MSMRKSGTGVFPKKVAGDASRADVRRMSEWAAVSVEDVEPIGTNANPARAPAATAVDAMRTTGELRCF